MTTLLTCYQHADKATMLKLMEWSARLGSHPAHPPHHFPQRCFRVGSHDFGDQNLNRFSSNNFSSNRGLSKMEIHYGDGRGLRIAGGAILDARCYLPTALRAYPVEHSSNVHGMSNFDCRGETLRCSLRGPYVG